MYNIKVYVVNGKRRHLLQSVGLVLISLSWVIESVGGYTTKSVTHGQCNARTKIDFPATELHHVLASTRLYCLVTEAYVCEQ